MKYECDLIRDIAVLYHDHTLSPVSEQIVADHLAECAPCRAYYAQDGAPESPSPADPPEAPVLDLSRKMRRYRTAQIVLFCLTVLTLLTTCLPWFGYSGLAEITGTVLFQHPAALAGLALFLFAIWYGFQRRAARLACGCSGWLLLLAVEVLEFLTIPQGSTVGISIGIFSYDLPTFSGISLAESLQYALPGFYVGCAAMVLCGVLFLLFARRTD